MLQLQKMLDFIIYFFANPTILGWSLAIVFGAIWLACYRPPIVSRPWLWAVLFASAILAPIAIGFTLYPLKTWILGVYTHFWSGETIKQWALLVNVPSMFLYGLIREGAKLVPVVVYWWRKGRNIDLKLGMAVGAMAGVGFAILEAQWTLNYALASGWVWREMEAEGVIALAVFWESFFILGLSVASTALAGWGLARGWGWQFYLLAAFLYWFPSYSYVLVSRELISGVQAEFLIAAWALLATGVALWLREKKVGAKRR